MAKKLASKATAIELQKALQDINNEMDALECSRRKIVNEFTQRLYPNINYDFPDFYIEINP